MIYLVEDDGSIRELVLYTLNNSGLEARGFETPGAFWRALEQEIPQLVMLDIMLPEEDGLSILTKLRDDPKTKQLPIMMLTAKGETDDRITGFNAGADDYLPKPFEPDELIARVRAMLRRSEDYHPTLLTWGDITLNPDTGVLSCGRESVRLSGREFQVMELFMRSPKVVLSADRIMERVWGWGSDAEINVVWVHISNLRKKIKSIGSGVTITANRGMGYLLEETK